MEPLAWWICLEECWKWWKQMPCMQILQWIPQKFPPVSTRPQISSTCYFQKWTSLPCFPPLSFLTPSCQLESRASEQLGPLSFQDTTAWWWMELDSPQFWQLFSHRFIQDYWSTYAFHKLGFWHPHGEWLHAIWGNKSSPQLWLWEGGGQDWRCSTNRITGSRGKNHPIVTPSA